MGIVNAAKMGIFSAAQHLRHHLDRDPDAEADDVIATLAAASPGREVLIMSADQDYYQLLRDPAPGLGPVRVLNTARRPWSRLIGPADVAARYGVTPAQ
jgi:DNA polymerase-1